MLGKLFPGNSLSFITDKMGMLTKSKTNNHQSRPYEELSRGHSQTISVPS